MIDLTNKIFTDENAARNHLEGILWPDGSVCPHCGARDQATKLKGKSTRPGVYKCRPCQKPFSVTVGTVLERSKIPLRKWVMAFYLFNASKKGMSAHQLHRMLGVTYKTAWFMMHRVREAMRELNPSPMGGEGEIVEIDETYIGGKEKNKHRTKRHSGVGGVGKEIAFALVERGGPVRSFHVPSVNAKTLRTILVTHVSRKSILVTDDAGQNRKLGREFARHETVNHSIEEYVRGPFYTNTVEGYFATMKRGIVGVYHHVSQQHLKRYLGEFDFRWNFRHVTDAERTDEAFRGIVGKRLTYRRTDEAANA